MFFQRRRDPRLTLDAANTPSCCIQDPFGFAATLGGRLLDLSRSGAAVHLDARALAAFDPKHEFWLTAALPGTSTRLKRMAKVVGQRSDHAGGAILGLHWADMETNDRYAQLQRSRFDKMLCELMGKGERVQARSGFDVVARVAALARSNQQQTS